MMARRIEAGRAARVPGPVRAFPGPTGCNVRVGRPAPGECRLDAREGVTENARSRGGADLVETVVLVHGLWVSGWSLGFLRRRLEQDGFRVAVFSFPTVRHGLGANASALAAFAAGQPGDRVHFVGHSLGGLVILRMLTEAAPTRPGRVVLIGSPVRGCRAARPMFRFAWSRALLGRCLPAWDPAIAARRSWPCEVGIIAGALPVGLGRLLVRLDEPSDGTVTVAETRLDAGADHLVLPTTHTGMLLSRGVARAIGHFLRQGRFERSPLPP
jgi:pimeloyl-ACP methyl ester carboxylesterase